MDDINLGWLSPTGEFVKCSSYDHTETAREILSSIKNIPEKDMECADDVLNDSGWVYIGISSLGRKEYRIYWRGHLTPEQIQFLRPYFENNSIPVYPYIAQRFREDAGN